MKCLTLLKPFGISIGIILLCLLLELLSAQVVFGSTNETLTITSGQLNSLVTISATLKKQLLISQTNCISLQSELEYSRDQSQYLYLELTNSQQTLLTQSQQLTNLISSLEIYKRQVNEEIALKNGQTLLWAGGGVVAGILTGVIITLFFHK